jgi:hypothetical protein
VCQVDRDRIDVRRQPPVVRDGCAPERTPAGRWPSDGVLVQSEQFAVNEILASLVPADAGETAVLGVHAPPGTGVAEVFGDLVAAIVTERARLLADLPDPAAAFGPVLTWGSRTVATLRPELAGFEVVQSAPPEKTPWTVLLGMPEGKAGQAGRLTTAERSGGAARAGVALPPVGTRWRDRAARADYFASTARLSDGVGAWAMLVARLGDRPANRAFAERWWQGAVRGTDVLFPAGESMGVALRQLKGRAVDWQTAVTWFRAALGKVERLAAERTQVADALARLSLLEQAFAGAADAAGAAQARLAELTAREPAVRTAVTVAEEEYRAALAALGAHEIGRPEMTTVTAQGVAALRGRGALTVAVAGGVRRGRNWRAWSIARRAKRAACTVAEQRLTAALREAETVRSGVTAARVTAAAGTAEVTRLTAEIEPLAELVASARLSWGDHVPVDVPAAETEDPPPAHGQETTAPWADSEFASARVQAFIAALELHKALIAAQADVFEGNLAALMELIAAETADGVPAEVRLAAWRSFFLVVPVVQVPFEATGALLDGLAPGTLGWLLAGGADQLPADDQPALLGWFQRAVLAGDALEAGGGVPAGGRYGTWLPPGAAEATQAPAAVQAPPPAKAAGTLADIEAAAETEGAEETGTAGLTEAAEAGTAADVVMTLPDAGPRWVGLPLGVVRDRDRSTVDGRGDVPYDGRRIADLD